MKAQSCRFVKVSLWWVQSRKKMGGEWVRHGSWQT